MTDERQPEALRLADWLEIHAIDGIERKAAAELRRLYEENVQMRDQRNELLKALREMVAGDAEAIAEADALGVPFPDEMLTAYRRAVAAIAKAGGAA